jgi:Big-like domain-containing protein/MBG domain-containing protein
MIRSTSIFLVVLSVAAFFSWPNQARAQVATAGISNFGFGVDHGQGISRGNAMAVDSKNVYFAYYYLGDLGSGRPGEVMYEAFPLVLTCPHVPCGFVPPVPATVDVIGPVLTTPGPDGTLFAYTISIGIDPQGVPHIVYQGGSGGGLKHAELCPCTDNANIGWQTETIPITAGFYTSMVVDKSGKVHVVSSSGGVISYTDKSNGVWSAVESIFGPASLSALSLAVDSGGNPQLAYADHRSTFNELVYAPRGSGPIFWNSSNFDIISNDDAVWASLALDKNDVSSVSYWGWPTNGSLTAELIYASRQSPGVWGPQSVDSFNFPCCLSSTIPFHMTSLGFSPGNFPRISYAYDYGSNAGVALAQLDGFSWDKQALDVDPIGGLNSTSLVVDGSDVSHVLYVVSNCPLAQFCSDLLYYERLSGANTPIGIPVAINLGDPATYGSPITVTFAGVSQVGLTTVALSDPNNGPAPPANFELGNPPIYYDFSTTALFSPPVTVCIPYGSVTNPSSLALMHYENGVWVDRTVSINLLSNTICADVSSFSPVAIFQKAGSGGSPSATITTLISSANPSVYGQTVTFTAGVSVSTGTPTGTVSFSDGTTTLATSPLNGSGVATFSASTLGAGTHMITASYAGDSTFTGSMSSAVAQTVNPAPLNVIANGFTRQYGQANPMFTASYSGFVNGENPGVLSGVLSCVSSATPSSPAGTYAINCSGLSSPNYAITNVLGTLTVTPAPLMVAAGSASRPYGANNPAVIPTVTGLVNGNVITATDSTSATPASPVGNYAIVPMAVGAPNVLNNYAISLVNGTLTVLPEPTSITVTLLPTSIVVGQSSTATITLIAPDEVTMIDPSALAAITLTSSVATDVLSNNGICTPVPGSTAGTASCVFSTASAVPNGRTLTATFAGSADLTTSTGTAQLMVTEPVQGQQSCIQSDFRNVAVDGGNYVWFNSIFRVRDVSKQKINIAFANSSVQFQYTDTNGNLVSVNLPIPNANIVIDPSVSIASTSFDAVNKVWNTTLPWDLDDNAFLSGVPWLVPAGGIPADVEPVIWCGTFAVDVTGAHIGWRWAAAAYSSFGSDGTTLGVKPMDTDFDNQAANHDRAGTPENYEQFVIPGARGKGGRNYTGSYSKSAVIE